MAARCSSPPPFIRERCPRRAASLTFTAPPDHGAQHSHHMAFRAMCVCALSVCTATCRTPRNCQHSYAQLQCVGRWAPSRAVEALHVHVWGGSYRIQVMAATYLLIYTQSMGSYRSAPRHQPLPQRKIEQWESWEGAPHPRAVLTASWNLTKSNQPASTFLHPPPLPPSLLPEWILSTDQSPPSASN